MKIKNLVLIMASVLVFQSAVAAYLTVYNASDVDMNVKVSWGSVGDYFETKYIPVGQSYVFNSSILHQFYNLTLSGGKWSCYQLPIPSSRTMRSGWIKLSGDHNIDTQSLKGTFEVLSNFDVQSSSEKKVTTRYARPCS